MLSLFIVNIKGQKGETKRQEHMYKFIRNFNTKSWYLLDIFAYVWKSMDFLYQLM